MAMPVLMVLGAKVDDAFQVANSDVRVDRLVSLVNATLCAPVNPHVGPPSYAIPLILTRPSVATEVKPYRVDRVLNPMNVDPACVMPMYVVRSARIVRMELSVGHLTSAHGACPSGVVHLVRGVRAMRPVGVVCVSVDAAPVPARAMGVQLSPNVDPHWEHSFALVAVNLF